MRRMYSQAELSAIIKEVFLEDVASGQIDLPDLIEQALPEVDFSNFDLEIKSIDASGLISGGELLEKMSGYSFIESSGASGTYSREYVYASAVKTGNKITFVVALKITRISDTIQDYHPALGEFVIPSEIGAKLFPVSITGVTTSLLDTRTTLIYQNASTTASREIQTWKDSNTKIHFALRQANTLTLNTEYYVRQEITFLLSDNMIE